MKRTSTYISLNLDKESTRLIRATQSVMTARLCRRVTQIELVKTALVMLCKAEGLDPRQVIAENKTTVKQMPHDFDVMMANGDDTELAKPRG